MKREDVEALVEFCESGHPAMVDAPIRLTRREAAALGRCWLAVDGAQIREVEEEMHGLVIRAHPLKKGQRVRIVPEQGEG